MVSLVDLFRFFPSTLEIPRIDPTPTGWAITPIDQDAYDAILDPRNVDTIKRIFATTYVDRPQKWYNYTVNGVPSTLRTHDDSVPDLDIEIPNEVLA